MTNAFGPKNEQERLVFAIEQLRADVQLAIQEVMLAKRITRSDLAKALGCSPANVTQLLAENGNPTLETIARVLYALGDVGKFQSTFLEEQMAARASRTFHREAEQARSWRMAGLGEASGHGKRLKPPVTSEAVLRVAKDAARRHAAHAHNQNILPPGPSRQAA